MELYADIFFVYNLIMDILVLEITAVIWGIKSRKIFLWCFISNIFYISGVSIFGLYWVMPYIFIGAAVFLALKPHSPARFLGLTATAYLTAFLLGSVSLGLMAVFDAGGFCIIPLGTLLLFIIKKISHSTALYKISGLYPLTLFTQSIQITLTAFVDSGNALKINGRPTIIIDPSAAQPVLPYIKNGFETVCKTVSGENTLFCFNANAIIGDKCIKNACIAVSNTLIEGSFNALINAEIFEYQNSA